MCYTSALRKGGLPIIRNFLHSLQGVLPALPKAIQNRNRVQFRLKRFQDGKIVSNEFIENNIVEAFPSKADKKHANALPIVLLHHGVLELQLSRECLLSYADEKIPLCDYNLMFEYGQLQALRQMVVGDQQDYDPIGNSHKGSMLNPGDIGCKKEEVAKPFSKVETVLGKKYQKREQQVKQEPIAQNKATTKTTKTDKNAIWTAQEINDLPVSRGDTRKTPEFQVMYRQKVGTQDVFLGLSDVDSGSSNCQQMKYVIHLPGTTLKQISLDINERAMVIQSKEYYLHQYFQYKVDPKESKAKFVSDKETLELILLVTRQFNL